jgi:hypothetical protein
VWVDAAGVNDWDAIGALVLESYRLNAAPPKSAKKKAAPKKAAKKKAARKPGAKRVKRK